MARRLAAALLALALTLAPNAFGGPKNRIDAQGDPLPNGAVLRLGTTRFRHLGKVTHVAYSPDGTLVASSSEDHTIRFWDPATGKQVRRLAGHTNTVGQFAFLPGGETLVSVGQDGTLRLWDVITGKELAKARTMPGGGGMSAWDRTPTLAVAPNGRLVATGGEYGEVILWRIGERSLTEARRVSEPTRVRALCFAPDSSEFIVSGERGSLAAVDVATGRLLRTFKGHEQWTCDVTYSPDGSLVASAGRDSFVRVWHARTTNEFLSLDACQFLANGVCFSPDGRKLAASDYWGNIYIWSADTGEQIAHFRGDLEWVQDLAFSPDGKSLAAGSWDVRIFDVASGKPRHEFIGHRQSVHALAFSPDGAHLATGGAHSPAHLWSMPTGTLVRTHRVHGHQICSLSYSPKGKYLAAGIMFHQLCVWNMETNQVEHKQVGDNSGWREFVAFSPNGKHLAWGGITGPLRLLNTHTWKVERKLLPAKSELKFVAYDPAGTLCVGAADSFWTFGDGKRSQIRVPGRFDLGAYSHKLKLVATASHGVAHLRGGIVLADALTGKEVRHIKSGDVYNTIRFSPSARYLAAVGAKVSVTRTKRGENTVTSTRVGQESVVHVWDTRTWKRVREFEGHAGVVHGMSFSPDETLLATGGDDTTVLVWDLAPAVKK